MKEKLQKIREDAIRQIEESGDLSKLNDVRVAVLGKKGELTAVLKSMKDVSPEERPLVGQLVNETRESIEKILDETKKKLEAAELDAKLRREVIDVTLPAKKNNVGHRHPNTIALEEVERIFTGMPLHRNVWCFFVLSAVHLTSPFMKKAFVAARRP